jgi:hypothetical protein
VILTANILSKKWKNISDLFRFIKWYTYPNKSDSVYFYTFHKCASTLFSKHVLSNSKGLRHVDYSRQIYKNHYPKKIDLNHKGYIYGPIRIQARPKDWPVYKLLLEKACCLEFVKGKTAVFFVRDPRDILVSQFYSFGFTHSISSNPVIKQGQITERKRIQNLDIDSYALEASTELREKFFLMYELSRNCERAVILKYEDMITNFDDFVASLTNFIKLDSKVIKKLYEESRPRSTEDLKSHKRSGKIANYKDKLSPSTIEKLNDSLSEILEIFNY